MNTRTLTEAGSDRAERTFSRRCDNNLMQLADQQEHNEGTKSHARMAAPIVIGFGLPGLG